MFGISLEFLTGRYYATAYDDRSSGEWPPHPARLFSALTAAWAEADPVSADEGLALDWLTEQGAPHIAASEATKRDAPTNFVPVNDAAVLRTQEKPYASLTEAQAKRAEAEQALLDATDAKQRKKAERALASAEKKIATALDRARKSLEWNGSASDKEREHLLPESRGRQARRFPSVTPTDPTVWYLWPDAEPDARTAGLLTRVAQRVARVGHSASLVSCCVVDDGPTPTHWPNETGDVLLRVPLPGQRLRLVEAHRRHQGNEPRVLPAHSARYSTSPPTDTVRRPGTNLRGEFIVFSRVSGPRLPSGRGPDVAEALRGALMKHADQPVHPTISGHRGPHDDPSVPHALYVPLPWTGSRYADSSILGVAVLLPAGVDPEGRRQTLRAIGRWERESETGRPDGHVTLTFGGAGALALDRVVDLEHRRTLQPASWTHSSRRWVTVTPVALDRNPGKLYSRTPEVAARAREKAIGTIRAACERAGLPAPTTVEISERAALRATLPARAFAPFPRARQKTRRVLVHVSLDFDVPVEGPLLLGAGRHRGLGLFLPMGDTP